MQIKQRDIFPKNKIQKEDQLVNQLYLMTLSNCLSLEEICRVYCPLEKYIPVEVGLFQPDYFKKYFKIMPLNKKPRPEFTPLRINNALREKNILEL